MTVDEAVLHRDCPVCADPSHQTWHWSREAAADYRKGWEGPTGDAVDSPQPAEPSGPVRTTP